ncbi:MAG: glucose-6-phosphate dehydrogenase [Verrucomicrobia bacterium]|nr:glucose-6-phosphate dehydrogenase [Verrucomicrobiota bacterium]
MLNAEHAEQLDELLTCRLDLGRRAVEPCSIVIFGASGDLTARKLIPALFHLFCEKQLPTPFRIIGFARREKDDELFRTELHEAFKKYSRTKNVEDSAWEAFAKNVFYCQGDISDPAAYGKLRDLLKSSNHEALRNNFLFYLATLPSQFAEIVENLHNVNLLSKEEQKHHWQRVVVEKPFGHDLASAQQLNNELTKYAHEKQIYRIDHYLGKETVQNILMFRFSNAIFEELWTRRSVEQVQITVSEKLGVGSRGGYYEEAGALRDMVQNHLLQVLALIAMEPPVSLEAESIRDEKVKLLKSIRPLGNIADNVVRGQYTGGEIDGQKRIAYREEGRVNPQSSTETFVAARLHIDNWRWSGVPFYLRTGKSLPVSASEVRIQFKPTPNVLFAAQCGTKLDANAITLRLQPHEGIFLRFNGKVPGTSTQLRPVRMHFDYGVEFGAYTPEAYERLLLEAISGDATLFIRRDEVEAAWSIVDPIRQAWDGLPLTERELYSAGTWGPAASDDLLAQHKHAWRKPHPIPGEISDGKGRDAKFE